MKKRKGKKTQKCIVMPELQRIVPTNALVIVKKDDGDPD
jgi:hypothetical protein